MHIFIIISVKNTSTKHKVYVVLLVRLLSYTFAHVVNQILARDGLCDEPSTGVSGHCATVSFSKGGVY